MKNLVYIFIYILIITPVGFIYRSFFNTKIKIKKDKKLKTYWINRENKKGINFNRPF